MPGYHFVKNHAETPDISSFIHLRTGRLLRRHVTNSSEYRPQVGISECDRFCPVRRSLGEGGFSKLCNPKVEHFHVSIPPEHDVLRLDVAMDNSGLVSGGERTRHLHCHVNSLTQLHRSARETLAQCLAFDQLARDIMNRVILADFVNGQKDRKS